MVLFAAHYSATGAPEETTNQSINSPLSHPTSRFLPAFASTGKKMLLYVNTLRYYAFFLFILEAFKGRFPKEHISTEITNIRTFLACSFTAFTFKKRFCDFLESLFHAHWLRRHSKAFWRAALIEWPGCRFLVSYLEKCLLK